MKKEKLTEEVIKKADFKTKQYKLSDGGGLYLLVHTNGSKYWRFDFRFNGKDYVISFFFNLLYFINCFYSACEHIIVYLQAQKYTIKIKAC